MFFLSLLLFFSAWPSRSARLAFAFSAWLCSLVFAIISFNLLYSLFCTKSTIKVVVVGVSLLWNLGCAEGISDFYPQSFTSQ